MARRTGEKVGWIGGWIGSFLWVAVLALLLLTRGRVAAGLVGLTLTAAAAAAIVLTAPWRHPETRFWKLLLPLYALLAGAVGWALAAFGGPGAVGFRAFDVAWLLPLLLPFFTAGARRWRDGER